MKNFNDFDLKYGILFNYSSLQIVANLLMSYMNFQYFEKYSIIANIFVSVFLISFSLLFLIVEKKNRKQPTLLLWNKVWESKKSINIFIWGGIFAFLCLQNFVMIRYFSFWVGLYDDFKVNHENFTLVKLLVLSLFLLGGLVIQLIFYFKSLKSYNMKDGVTKIMDGYNLDFNKTYFFTEDGRVVGFQTGSYIFKPGSGLFDGKRWYSSSVVLDYLNIADIDFNDLDEGHVKNIEMYAIGR